MRCVAPHHTPVLEHDAPRAQAIDEVQVVTGDHHRHADVVEALEELHDLEREVRIEITGGLIGDEQRRLADDGAGDADALLLAGRQLERQVALLAEESDLIERRAHALVDLAPGHARDDERQGDVVGDRPVEEQLVILEHDAQAPAELRGAACLDGRGVLVIDEYLTPCRALDERDQLQDAALARTGMTREKHELAGLDAKRYARERLAAGGVALVHLVEVDHDAPSSALFKSADTNSDALKTPKSSVSSPTPTKRMGMPSRCAMASTTPPLAVPSSLVTASPVTPSPLWNSAACATAFWPMVPSRISSTSCGAPGSSRASTRLTFFSSSIK